MVRCTTLVSITQGEAVEVVELRPGMGLDAWKRLFDRYNPIGELYS